MNRRAFAAAPFGILMAAALAVDTHRWSALAAVVVAAAVIAGVWLRGAATVAVVAATGALAICDTAPVLAALCGLAAAAYLVLGHTRLTRPTSVSMVGFTAAGTLVLVIPVGPGWLALLAAPIMVILVAVLLEAFPQTASSSDTAPESLMRESAPSKHS
jgi:hypothetical protein